MSHTPNDIDSAFDQLWLDLSSLAHGDTSGSGFHTVHCPICKNTGEKKAGFKLEGDKIVYNCFRGSCPLKATVYEKGEFVPRKFKDLAEAFDIDIPPVLITTGRKNNKMFKKQDSDLYERNVYKDMRWRESLVPLEETKNKHFPRLIEERQVLPRELYIETEGDFKGCMAIPIWFYDKLIGYEYYSRKGQYFTFTTNEHLILPHDKYLPHQVLLVEGVMDVLCFPNTVGVKRYNVSPKQAYHLRGKDVTVLPDRSGSGLYESAEKYGWKVTLPPWQEKDLNAAIMKKGILVVAQMIHDHTMPVNRKSRVVYEQWRDRTNDERQGRY